MKPYSKEFRGEVLAACDRGGGTREVATRFNVSESWVRRVKQERRELNKVAPLLTRRRVPLWAPLAERIQAAVAQKPDITLRELKAELGTDLSLATLCVALQRLRLTFKKKVLVASERTRPDVAQRREQLRLEQPHLNPERLVFIDETWAKTNMTRPRGRALKGQRLLATVPHGHWKTTTFLAALRSTGLTAPLVVDGAINGEIFVNWVRHHLVPTLTPGDIVVMDNLGAHKVSGVREAIQAAGARVVYLPPYSPDLNPIELVFSKFKWLLKSASARTVEALWSACGDMLDRFTEAECRNCFRHCGYRYT